MSKKLSNAPVYYAVVQSIFNPVANMVTYVNIIQDKLRLEGYTLFGHQSITQLQIESPSKMNVSENPIWQFTKADRTSGFILSQSYLTFHTTHYESHEEFFKNFLVGLEITHSIVKLEHVSRLGLRYLNAILPRDDESVAMYLNAGLHGVQVNKNLRYSLFESVFETKIEPPSLSGTFVNRVHTRKGALGYPPDITPPNLSTKPKFQDWNNHIHAVLDLDHFLECQMQLDFKRLKSQLLSLHKMIDQAFYANITEHAKMIWS